MCARVKGILLKENTFTFIIIIIICCFYFLAVSFFGAVMPEGDFSICAFGFLEAFVS